MAFERIRQLENDLSNGMTSTRDRSIIHTPRRPVVSDTWVTPPITPPTPTTPQKTGPNWFRRFFIGAIIFCALGGIAFAVSFFLDPHRISEKNVTVAVDAKNIVDGGESFLVTVTVTNKNKVALELARLSISYPVTPGVTDGFTQDKPIGTLAAGEVREIPLDLQLYGAANTVRTITARLEYRTQNSNAIFESVGSHEITLRSSPVRLAVNAPESAYPNQEVSIAIVYASNLETASPAAVMHVDYPIGFQFLNAEPKPDLDNSIWKLGNLVPGQEKTITITGTMSGILNEGKVFTATIGSEHAINDRAIGSVFSTIVTTTTIREPFLNIAIVPGGRAINDRYVISGGTETDMRLVWKNTLTTPISNAIIKVSFDGTAFGADSVRPGSGFYDSATKTITWTGIEDPSLQNIAPGATGEINFGLISSIPKIDATQTVDALKPYIDTVASVTALGPSGETLSIDAVAKERILVSTQANLIGTASYAKGPFKNTGSVQPRAEQETTYTVTWKVTNTSSTLDRTKVTAILPQWASWKSMVSPQTANNNIVYNGVTREITWNVGSVPPRTGYGTDPYQVSFQIGVKPSKTQIGSVINIVGDAHLAGYDTETGVDVALDRRSITTQLVNEGKNISGQVQ